MCLSRSVLAHGSRQAHAWLIFNVGQNKVKVDRTPRSELTKLQLHELADAMLLGVDGAKEEALRFFGEETRGIWHNRARAMIARRLKQTPVTDAEGRRLIEIVQTRLLAGCISEQFKDQLRLALFLDESAMLECAKACRSSKKPHVVRYAQWVLKFKQSEPNQSLEPTRVLGTSAAEPPRVPSTRVAHL